LFHVKNCIIFGNSSFRVASRFIEEIPQYGGMPMYDGEWKGSVEDAVLYIKSHFV
jgi:hypothetical protein